MTALCTTRRLLLVSGLICLLAACGDDDGADRAGDPQTASDAAAEAGVAWFGIDQAEDTVSIDGVTYPIMAEGTFAVDGKEYDFVSHRCPVPESGSVVDIQEFFGVGYSPEGRPFNLNAGAPTMAVNTTWDADWRSTDTAYDMFTPVWSISGKQMRAVEETVRVVETGETVSGSITVTCR